MTGPATTETNKLLICYDDITNRDLWPTIQEALKNRLPLTHVRFENKFRKSVHVSELEVEFLPIKHHRILRLRQHQNNPTTWFRLPYCHIIIVTAMETTDYKASLRPRLTAMMNGPRGTLEALCETLIIYVRPLETEVQAKGPKKVFEKLRDDFNMKKNRDRVVRLDLFDVSSLKDAQGMVVGLDSFESSLKDCIRTAFQTRQTAYDEEARKLMSHRMDMRGNFGTLFLVKDSLALMLESVGLLEDALREYFELEAACLEALEEGGTLHGQPFGGDEKGDDVAVLMTSTWKSMHQSVLANKPLKEFKLRQYLFSAKARIYFRLERVSEVVDRGLKFIQDFSKLISERESEAGLPSSFREIWAFSACLSVASTAAKHYASRDHDLQNKPGPWDASDKARIQISGEDWDVGVCGLEDVTADLDLDSLGGNTKRTNQRLRDRQQDVRQWPYYSSLGHLYASAREELRRIFDAIYGTLETEAEGLAGFRADMLPSFTPVCLSASRTTSLDTSHRRLSLSVQKTSSLIESLQQRASRKSMISKQLSFESEGQISLDLEGMPSWMTRAGLASTPKHSSKNIFTQLQTPPDSPRHSETSFVSVASEAASKEQSELELELEDGVSMISYETSMTPITESQFGEGVNLTLHSIAGSSGSRAPRSESIVSSADQPFTRPIQRADTTSTYSLTSYALGDSGFNPEASSDSFQGAYAQALVVPDKLNWVVDWRIRRALASEDLYEDLFVELTLAAAWCYARMSALLRVDVAPLLLSHGLVTAAQQLYLMKADMYLREGWDVLSGHVLPQVRACLRGDDPKQLMTTCLTYLSLAEVCRDEGETTKMMTDFVDSAKELGEMETPPSTLIVAPTLQISPTRNGCSELFPGKDSEGLPILAPPAVARTSLKESELSGAHLLHAGDMVTLEVEVQSQLPEPLELTNVVLCLVKVGEEAASRLSSLTSFVRHALPKAITLMPSIQETKPLRSLRRTVPEVDRQQNLSSSQLFCDAIVEDEKGILIVPGATLLRFHCCPLREGLYAALYMIGDCFGTSLCLPLHSKNPPRPHWIKGLYKKKPNPLEALEPFRSHLNENVVLNVQPATQRIDVTVILPQGCLISGTSQWFGILLKGRHDADIQKGTFTLSLSHITDPVPLPSTAYITNETSQEGTGTIRAWIDINDGSFSLPPGFLYNGMLTIWMLLDLAKTTGLETGLSTLLHQATGFDFDRAEVGSGHGDNALHLETHLEYFSGCWRSHVSLLKVPILNAFGFESSFLKMNSTTMFVTVRLESQLPVQATLESVQLELFCTRKQNVRLGLMGPVFPLELHPSEVINIAFRLTKNEAKILSVSARESDEQLVGGEFTMKFRTDCFSKHVPLQSLGRREKVTGHRFPPPVNALQPLSSQTCHFRHELELDVLMGGEGPKNDLFKISLLPPPNIALGTPVALTWMLERQGTFHSKENIAYEIVLEAGWQACVPLRGSLYAPFESMSPVTLETVFIAVSEGELQAPRLVLTQNKIQSPLVYLKVWSHKGQSQFRVGAR